MSRVGAQRQCWEFLSFSPGCMKIPCSLAVWPACPVAGVASAVAGWRCPLTMTTQMPTNFDEMERCANVQWAMTQLNTSRCICHPMFMGLPGSHRWEKWGEQYLDGDMFTLSRTQWLVFYRTLNPCRAGVKLGLSWILKWHCERILSLAICLCR